jgi:hypothetical protein
VARHLQQQAEHRLLRVSREKVCAVHLGFCFCVTHQGVCGTVLGLSPPTPLHVLQCTIQVTVLQDAVHAGIDRRAAVALKV